MRRYNPRKCNSASAFSGYIEREMSNLIFALPTNNEVVEVVGRTLTGGFNCVNTRLAFYTANLMRNISRVEFDKMKIHENLQALKEQDLKVGYKLKLDDEKTYRDKRVISKILKLDENNHYGYAITKPLPTGCIKNQKKMLTG